MEDNETGTETEADGCSSPIYEANFDGHLPLHWLQPNINDHRTKDQTETILPSFRDLQLKTHRTLYGTTNSTVVPPRDKSPKGSVDLPIRHLVDLINSHSRFCTLSSCSGRLSLFDPSGNSSSSSSSHESDSDSEKANNFTEESGKGRGNWVLVSHDPIAPESLIEAIKASENGSSCSNNNLQNIAMLPWTFRFEPMLMHVAAASLEDGRRLLTIALNLGFRESGLVVTEKRVTVAIRSHSLSTATPLFMSNQTEFSENTTTAATATTSASLCVPPSYLRALVQDANQRLEANWRHLDKLYRSMESVLFTLRSSPPPLIVRNPHESLSGIPVLNLWNAVSIGPILEQTCKDVESKQEVWILGGYGCGPKHSERHSSAKRSSKLYKLEKDPSHGDWKGWKVVASPSPSSKSELGVDSNSPLGVRWQKEATFPDLQGMASCRWRESMYLFWGGRKSPKAPSDALFLLDATEDAQIGIVCDVRGDLPSPRWGHQLIALGDDRVVLLGGCNYQEGALDDVFVLHYCAKEEKNDCHHKSDSVGYFCWERLLLRLPTPRFHFGAALLNGGMIVMLGGLESTQELLLPFESDTESACGVWACKIGISRRDTTIVPKTHAMVIGVETSGLEGSFESFFGMACCTLLSKNLLLVTGGVQSNASTMTTREPLQAYWVSSNFSGLCIRRIGLDYDLSTDDSTEEKHFDFGSLVHHCCVPIADNELLVVGGGVPSFAFGESYAR